MLSWLLRSMQEGGCVASIGSAGGNTYEGSVLPFIMRRVQLFGVMVNPPGRSGAGSGTGSAASGSRRSKSRFRTWAISALEDLMEHSLRQLEGTTSGRVLVDFGK